MPEERFGIVQFDGADQTVVGPDIKPGEVAPDFVALAQDWTEVRPLRAGAGKVIVLTALLSLDTGVCDRETRRFNLEATRLADDAIVYALSTDLPYTQKRWCGAAGVDRVVALSDHLHVDFGTRYGCLIKEKRILRRAVFVVGRDGRVSYSDYMRRLGDEPNYDEVLNAVREAR